MCPTQEDDVPEAPGAPTHRRTSQRGAWLGGTHEREDGSHGHGRPLTVPVHLRRSKGQSKADKKKSQLDMRTTTRVFTHTAL